MKSRIGSFQSGVLALVATVFAGAALQPSAHAANVRFQGRTYSVTISLFGTGNITTNGDLIFVQQGNSKFLATPNDATFHGDFDIANQRYYMLNRTTGNVNSFTSIDAALIDITTLNDINDTTQNPAADFNGTTTPLESFNKPLAIPSTSVPTDVCIVENTNFIGYRTDGPSLTDEIIYTNSREASSAIQEQFNVSLKNADPVNGNLNVFLEYDVQTNNYLLVQLALDSTNNSSTLSRITAYSRDGVIVSELILDPIQNTTFANFSGFAGGITEDPGTGTLYLLDRNKRQVIILTVVPPAITAITPTSGTIQGGTKTTISGVTLPSDAQVFFGGIAATSVTVNDAGTTITAITPAHAEGTVDVTVTGTGITTTLTLPAAYTFVNEPPTAKLNASPTAGPSPLAVAFSVTAADSDGTIAGRTIDFGDSTKFDFPAELGVTTTSHTYAADGVYSATLTAKDNLGATATDSVTIVVGATELILRSLAFNVTDIGGAGEFPDSKDTLKMKGEIILPEDAALAGAKLTVGFVNEAADASQSLAPCPAELLITNAFELLPVGGQYCVAIDAKQRVSNKIAKFTIVKLKKRGYPADTHSFSFTGTGFRLRTALQNAGVLVDLKADPSKVQPERSVVRIIVRISIADGTTLQYTRLAVVDIKSARKTGKAGVTLTRH